MPTPFADLHVVVTGGTGALGSAVVGLLLDQGAHCHVPCYDNDELETFAHRGHERVRIATDLDLTREGDVESFYAETPALWASINIAGGFAMSAVEETSLDDFRRMIDMNLTTCFLCCREAVKRIRASGKGGRIVNVAARPALVPAGGMIAYTTSKAGVSSLTQCLSEELKDERIWVNAVAPSIIDTPANREAMPKADHDSWPTPDQIARTIVFLSSPENRVTRGGVVPVYGRG